MNFEGERLLSVACGLKFAATVNAADFPPESSHDLPVPGSRDWNC